MPATCLLASVAGRMRAQHAFGLSGFEEMDEAITIGERNVWGNTQTFGLLREDRRRHIYCVGKTGSGKSTLLKHLLRQDILAGHGVGLIDPHGDLAEEILNFVPKARTKHLVYFNPADTTFPVGLNLFADAVPETRPLIASGIVSCFKHIWGDSWGPRLEYLLYAAVLTLTAAPSATLLGIPRLFTDSHYRQRILRFVTDPVLLAFWEQEFEQYDKRFRNEIIAPVQNKIGAILMAPALRNIVGQVQSRVKIPFVMEEGRIFIANLSKGKLGEDKASLLGSLLVTQFQLAALKRARVPERTRRDFYLYIDEFQNVGTEAFCSILSEARKYRLNLTISNQFTAQLRPEIRDSVFGNVGSIVAFRTGVDDAEMLAREFGPAHPPETFSGLSNYEILAKLLHQGDAPEPFRGRTLPPGHPVDEHRAASLIRVSRERFGTPRARVENKIKRWFNIDE